MGSCGRSRAGRGQALVERALAVKRCRAVSWKHDAREELTSGRVARKRRGFCHDNKMGERVQLRRSNRSGKAVEPLMEQRELGLGAMLALRKGIRADEESLERRRGEHEVR